MYTQTLASGYLMKIPFIFFAKKYNCVIFIENINIGDCNLNLNLTVFMQSYVMYLKITYD